VVASVIFLVSFVVAKVFSVSKFDKFCVELSFSWRVGSPLEEVVSTVVEMVKSSSGLLVDEVLDGNSVVGMSDSAVTFEDI